MDGLETTEVVVPASREEAVQAFGDGAGVTVVGGGTILMPDIVHGRVRPGRAILLSRAGLSGVQAADGRTTIGAATPVSELEALADPLGTAARRVADPEIRAQATVGGNICAPPGAESPRGDLQAALIALGATVRTAGAGGESEQPIEDFLGAGPDGRLVLEVSFADPEAGAYAELHRPHAHAYTALAVCVARTAEGVRVAATGAGPRAVRCRSVEEALAGGADSRGAADKILADADPQDDALASAWYRQKMLPLLAQRALDDLEQ